MSSRVCVVSSCAVEMKLPCATDTATRAVNRVQLLVGASIGMERERQQNDNRVNG